MESRENIWNVPNVLTMLRMAMIGVFLWLFFSGYPIGAVAVFIAAGITDFLDGYIARKRKMVTSFGKLMDPLADKLMLIAALASLVSAGRVPVWVVAVVICKELVMVVGGYCLFQHGFVAQARHIGKVAAVGFIIAVVATFLHEYLAPVDMALLYAAVALSVAAMVWYIVDTARYFARKQ